MDYLIIRRFDDDREEHSDWDSHRHNIRVVGDVWQVEGEELAWRVVKVTAGDGTRPAAIVLEPIDD